MKKMFRIGIVFLALFVNVSVKPVIQASSNEHAKLSTAPMTHGQAKQNDDHGDTPSKATSIQPNSVTEGAFGNRRDIDCFKIELQTGGTLTVFTISKIKTEASLTNNHAQLAWDNGNGSGRNFHIQEKLIAGIYFLGISGWSPGDEADYALVSRFEPNFKDQK